MISLEKWKTLSPLQKLPKNYQILSLGKPDLYGQALYKWKKILLFQIMHLTNDSKQTRMNETNLRICVRRRRPLNETKLPQLDVVVVAS